MNAVRPEPAGRDKVISEIRARFDREADVGLAKYMQLRRAVLASIEERAVEPGDQLPPEEDLAGALGLSLGTVRRALEHLASGGIVIREHGRGTFVAQHSRALDDSWHYRFLDDDGRTLLPVYSHVIDRQLIHDEGPWTGALGPDPAGYARIRRLFDVDEKLLSYSEFYLRASRFSRMLELPIEMLESVNLKKVLHSHFAATTLYVEQRMRVERMGDEVCERLALKRRSHGLFLEIVAHTYDHVAISYHRIYVPPTRHLLDLSANDPQQRGAGQVARTSS